MGAPRGSTALTALKDAQITPANTSQASGKAILATYLPPVSGSCADALDRLRRVLHNASFEVIGSAGGYSFHCLNQKLRALHGPLRLEW